MRTEENKEMDKKASDRTTVDTGAGREPAASAGVNVEIPSGDKYGESLARKKAYPNGMDILAIIGIILGSAIVSGLLLGILGMAFTIEKEIINMLAYALQFGMSIIFVIMLQRQRGMRKNLLRLNVRSINLPLILYGVLLIFAAGVVIEPLLDLFPSRYLDIMDIAIGRGGWAIMTTVILAPILEEVLFRGLLLGAINEKHGAFRAVFVSAAIFGVIHIIPQQIVNAFVIGIILGYIYVRTKSLVAVIFIHALNNGLAYVLREVFGSTSEAMSTREMIGSDTWFYIVYGLCVILFAVGMYGMIKAMNRLRPTAEKA